MASEKDEGAASDKALNGLQSYLVVHEVQVGCVQSGGGSNHHHLAASSLIAAISQPAKPAKPQLGTREQMPWDT